MQARGKQPLTFEMYTEPPESNEALESLADSGFQITFTDTGNRWRLSGSAGSGEVTTSEQRPKTLKEKLLYLYLGSFIMYKQNNIATNVLLRKDKLLISDGRLFDA